MMQRPTQSTRAMENAENKFLSILYSHVRQLFKTTPLPSHDHDHHLRVWFHAKTLVKELAGINILISPELAENLILAVFFHDTGLTRNLKADHGLDSRKLCEKFIDENLLLFRFDMIPALIAIEKHDDKNYRAEDTDDSVNVLTLLSLCDDLDAYGAIGILRYAEIYLLRGISAEKLPGLVLANIKKRFEYFASHGWLPASYFQNHKKRFDLTCRFYQEMIQNPGSEISIANNQIVNIYMDQVTGRKTEIEEFVSVLKDSENNILQVFGEVLKTELNLFFSKLPE